VLWPCADRFVKDAHEVVKAGDVVKVKVLEVDVRRKRISLSMRRDASPDRHAKTAQPERNTPRPKKTAQSSPSQGALGAALSDALRRSK
jgi:uncharacterized protein